MALFGLIKDKCFYCRTAIEKGKVHLAQVAVLGYVGKFNKKFCSQEHVLSYNQELKERSKSSRGSCCG